MVKGEDFKVEGGGAGVVKADLGKVGQTMRVEASEGAGTTMMEVTVKEEEDSGRAGVETEEAVVEIEVAVVIGGVEDEEAIEVGGAEEAGVEITTVVLTQEIQ